jgi:hypothetical protein
LGLKPAGGIGRGNISHLLQARVRRQELRARDGAQQRRHEALRQRGVVRTQRGQRGGDGGVVLWRGCQRRGGYIG